MALAICLLFVFGSISKGGLVFSIRCERIKLSANTHRERTNAVVHNLDLHISWGEKHNSYVLDFKTVRLAH